MSKFLEELKRRNVIRMAGLYLVGAWLIAQISETLLPIFHTPDWVLQTIILLLAIGFVPALVFSWVFELTPEGLKRDAQVAPEQSIAPQTARRMDRAIIAALLVALCYFGFDKYVLAPRREAAAIASAVQAPAKSEAPAVSDKSIAVLPFENMSEDKANGYFADGIQDQILTGLSKIGDLKVISRTSTLKYASRPDNLSQIAKELGVSHILEGSVQRSGDQVRINVQLIDAASDSHLWAEIYDRTLDNVFAVESEVAQKIAESLAANLSSGERDELAEKPTDVPDAYDAYLKARVLSSRVLQTRAQADEELAAYRQAVRLDPKFALAWAQLARECFRIGWIGMDASGELRKEGERALARAVELAPNSAQTEVARGVHMYYIERDFAGALAVMDSLKSRLPNDSEIWVWAGYLSRRLGKMEESDRNFARARALSPNDSNIAFHHGVTLVVMGECARGIEELDASQVLSPDSTQGLGMKLACARSQGSFQQARAFLAAADGRSPVVQGMSGTQSLIERDYRTAIDKLQRAIAESGDTLVDASMNGYLPARVDWTLDLALSRERLGEKAQAQALYRQIKAEATSVLDAKPANRYVETGWHLALGMALAGLGEHEAAARQGAIAVALVPESADKLEGPGWALYQARIYALGGDAAHAVPLLRHLMVVSSSLISVQNLRDEPYWDALRQDPGFKALLQEKTAR